MYSWPERKPCVYVLLAGEETLCLCTPGRRGNLVFMYSRPERKPCVYVLQTGEETLCLCTPTRRGNLVSMYSWTQRKSCVYVLLAIEESLSLQSRWKVQTPQLKGRCQLAVCPMITQFFSTFLCVQYVDESYKVLSFQSHHNVCSKEPRHQQGIKNY